MTLLSLFTEHGGGVPDGSMQGIPPKQPYMDDGFPTGTSIEPLP